MAPRDPGGVQEARRTRLDGMAYPEVPMQCRAKKGSYKTVTQEANLVPMRMWEYEGLEHASARGESTARVAPCFSTAAGSAGLRRRCPRSAGAYGPPHPQPPGPLA